MKGLKRNKKRVLGFALALVMVVSVFTSANMFEVKAETSSKTLIESVTLEFDWSKFESSEITFDYDWGEFWVTMTGTGVVQTDDPYRYLLVKPTQAHVDAGYITSETLANVDSDGWTPIWNYSEEYVIGSADVVGYFLRLSAEEEYDFSETTRVALADDNMILESMSVSNNPTYGEEDNNGYLSLTINLGTGADIEEAINPSTQEPVTPPAENVELMEAFTDEILAFYSDFVGVEITNESTNIFEDGEEIHPNATGTAQYIDEARLWWVSCAWIDSQEGVMIEVVDINDTTKSNEIAEKFSEWEYYQSFPQETFQYHNGEYIIFVVIPKIYTEAGLTLDVAKAYLDKAYNEATNQVTEEKNDYDANVVNTTNIANKIELTEAEKAAIDNGVQLDVVLSFQDTGAVATTEEQKIIEKKLEDKTIGTFLEIDLSKKIGAFETKLSETNGMIEITFELPQELKNADTSVNRTYSVMRYHDGIVDVLDAEYDVATGKLSFETDKFSTYAVIYSDEEVDSTSSTSTPSTSTPSTSTPSTSTPSTSTSTTTNTTTNTTTSTPQTGDTANMFVYIALLCFAMYSVVLVLRKQRKF